MSQKKARLNREHVEGGLHVGLLVKQKVSKCLILLKGSGSNACKGK